MRRYLILIGFILLSITAYSIIETYGLFETNNQGDINIKTAKWIINLNNVDISQGFSENFVIDNISYSENSKIADGYIAPGRTGYFDITLNPTGTEVAVRYDIKIDLSKNNYGDNIHFSVTDLSAGNAVLTAPYTYSGVITLASISSNKTITLRLNVEWVNYESYNESDSLLGTTPNSKLSIPVSIDIKQYLGEEIKPI